MWVKKLAVVVDLTSQIGVFFARRLQYDLSYESDHHLSPRKFNSCPSHLRAIGKLVRGKVNLAKGALPN